MLAELSTVTQCLSRPSFTVMEGPGHFISLPLCLRFSLSLHLSSLVLVWALLWLLVWLF